MSLNKNELIHARDLIQLMSDNGYFKMSDQYLSISAKQILKTLDRELAKIEAKANIPTPLQDALIEWDDKYRNIIDKKFDTYEEYSEATKDLPPRPSTLEALKEVLLVMDKVDKVTQDKPMDIAEYTKTLNPVETADKAQEIVNALLNGGLVCSWRASARSQAMIRILKQDDDTIVFCNTEAQVKELLDMTAPHLIDVRIFLNTKENRHKCELGQCGLSSESKSKVYIYEYEPGVEYPPFFAAVTSKLQVV